MMNRRRLLKMVGMAMPAMALKKPFAQASSALAQNLQQQPHAAFSPTSDSLKAYSIPDWFADAKFGIWAHWGPQSAIGNGDWYARNMYIEGSPQYEYHLKRFGPQSKVGYKDTIPVFTASKWDPDQLIALYVEAGAKYFFSMGVHHDNYDLWNSKYQPRWNSVMTGPRRDIVGEWATAARRRGLRFGVSEHLSNSFDWFAPSHLSDTKGPFAGISYDGADPRWADLYHDYAQEPPDFARTAKAMGRVAPVAWKEQYLRRVKDLVDQHQPDLLYTDGGIPFQQYGLATVAELYNVGDTDYRGLTESVYFSKDKTECAIGTCVLDRERGVLDGISPLPWQTDTCIGDWHYKEGIQYKTPKKVIDLFVDIVSKNGNLLLNFPLPATGELDAEERKVLAGITEWMKRNGEGIFATRPWKIYGEGPATKVVIPSSGSVFDPNESKRPDLTAADIRFTAKRDIVFAFIQGRPGTEVIIESFGLDSELKPGKVMQVSLLGSNDPLTFVQEARRLRVAMPAQTNITDLGFTLKCRFI